MKQTGVNIGNLVQARKVRLTDLSWKVIGIDAHNVSYQFLSRIRRRGTGEPLRDKKGRVTSHLSGIFYRTASLVEVGVKPIFVWDGKPPKFKDKTVIARRALRKEAEKKWFEALERGEDAMIYAQAASKLTHNMIEESIKLLNYMGIPSIRAPSEGEAQLAKMTVKGDIWASASQDWDSLLFNSSRLIRNLSISGRRKLPRKNVYIEVKPEIVELEKVLNNLGITRKQLIILGMLVGTDYNTGVKGVGSKTALRLVRKYKTLDHVLANVKLETKVDPEKIFKFFLDPPVTKTDNIKWKRPNTNKLIKFMVDEHDFSLQRVEKVVELLEERISIKEKSLENFFD